VSALFYCSDDGKPSVGAVKGIFLRSVAHEPPLCAPAIDDPENEVSEELMEQILQNMRADNAGGEPISKCSGSAGLKSEFLGVCPFIVVTVLFVALPLSGLLSIRGTGEGVWTLGELILLKALYGAILEIPISWIICVSTMLWYQRRVDRILAKAGEDSDSSHLEKGLVSHDDEEAQVQG